MTERKPPGVCWQSWIDKQVEEAKARGDFDHLPGTGKPLPGIDQPRDELWWVRDKLKREGVEYLPPSLAIRRDAQAARTQAVAAPTEREARRILTEINDRIRYLNSHTVDGPPTTLMPLDVEEVVDRWRELHPGVHEAPGTESATSDAGSAPPQPGRTRLLRRLRGQRDPRR